MPLKEEDERIILERFAGPKRWNWKLEDGGVFGEIVV